MIRGTTPTLEFTVPFDTSILAEAWVTLSQNDKVVLNKRLKDCKCDERKLSVKLTQEETLLLDCKCMTEIQIRARTQEGEALVSQIITEDTGRILKDGVI